MSTEINVPSYVIHEDGRVVFADGTEYRRAGRIVSDPGKAAGLDPNQPRATPEEMYRMLMRARGPATEEEMAEAARTARPAKVQLY